MHLNIPDPSLIEETGEAGYRAYMRLFVRMNPGRVLPIGEKKKWYDWRHVEHPLTSEESISND